MEATLRQLLRRPAKCLVGLHELIADVVDADPGLERPARLRLRCLHCDKVTKGWEQGTPAYRRTQTAKPEALVAQRLIHRLTREPLMAADAGPCRILEKSAVAKKRRSR